jgi:hypothetical protein
LLAEPGRSRRSDGARQRTRLPDAADRETRLMTKTPTDIETTRRVVIMRFVLAGAAGVVAANTTPRPAAAAPAKLPPNEIGYQATPKGAARCELCVNWQPPNACKLVAGAISPSGWCGLFVRKT